MGVIINDMDMPKNCKECKLFHLYFDLDGVIHYICKFGNMEICGDLENKRNVFCPLIESSVQPEIIRCKDCKNYYFADNRVPSEQSWVCNEWGVDQTTPMGYCFKAERR